MQQAKQMEINGQDAALIEFLHEWYERGNHNSDTGQLMDTAIHTGMVKPGWRESFDVYDHINETLKRIEGKEIDGFIVHDLVDFSGGWRWGIFRLADLVHDRGAWESYADMLQERKKARADSNPFANELPHWFETEGPSDWVDDVKKRATPLTPAQCAEIEAMEAGQADEYEYQQRLRAGIEKIVDTEITNQMLGYNWRYIVDNPKEMDELKTDVSIRVYEDIARFVGGDDVLKPDADEQRYTLFAEVRVPLRDVQKAKALLQSVMDLW